MKLDCFIVLGLGVKIKSRVLKFDRRTPSLTKDVPGHCGKDISINVNHTIQKVLAVRTSEI